MADQYMRTPGYSGPRGISYTPFASQAGATMAQAMGQRRDRRREERENKLAQAAYMGDPTALQDLAAANPELAMQVEDQAGQRQQRERAGEQHQAAQEASRRKFAMQNQELLQDLTAELGAIDDIEMAKAHAKERAQQIASIMGPGSEQVVAGIAELTPEAHERFKELRQVITGDDWERSGGPVIEEINGKPAYVQKFVNPKTQETRSVPTSTARAITGHDVERRGAIKEAETRAGKTEERIQGHIDLGVKAADSMASINRGLELLDSVSTGGLAAANLRAKQLFGVEGADEGELSNLLGKAVLSQLRDTFGAQFTAAEGKQLERIEANFGRSPESNRRLLENARKLSERVAERGIRAAEAAGDFRAADEIRQAMEFDLGGEGGASGRESAPGGPAQVTTREQYEALPAGAEYVAPDGSKRRKQ